MIKITIDDKAVIRNLKLLPGKTKTRVKIGLRAGGMVVANEAKIRVPVITGTLKRSIHTEAVEVSPDRLSVQVGTRLNYAEKIEFGGSRRVPEGYLRVSIDEKGDEAVREIAESLKILLR